MLQGLAQHPTLIENILLTTTPKMAPDPSTSAPTSKKRTMSDSLNPPAAKTNPTPLVFRLPDQQKPDFRFVVFDQEYHVHSMILKLYSNYFRKFLDSPDKSGNASSPSTEFRYDYATAVDDDGAWALEPADRVGFFSTSSKDRFNPVTGSIY